MRHLIILILCLLSAHSGTYANGLTFSTERFDFGDIAEEGGNVEHIFTMRNDGERSVVILKISTSCGCTIPEYSKQPIMSGATTDIRISFDPRFRPGVFLKDIYVYTSEQTTPYKLQIEGRVTPRVRSIEERYPYTLGKGGRIGALYLSISNIGEELSLTNTEYFNGSERAIEVEFRPRHSSPYLKLFADEGLAAGEQAIVEVGYFVEDRKALDSLKRMGSEQRRQGVLRDTIDIFVNGERSDKSLFIRGFMPQK